MEETYLQQPKVDDLKDILGPIKVTRDLYENNATAGVVIGLAWTAVGDILFIESALSKGKGQLSITGNLGKIMKSLQPLLWNTSKPMQRVWA